MELTAFFSFIRPFLWLAYFLMLFFSAIFVVNTIRFTSERIRRRVLVWACVSPLVWGVVSVLSIFGIMGVFFWPMFMPIIGQFSHLVIFGPIVIGYAILAIASFYAGFVTEREEKRKRIVVICGVLLALSHCWLLVLSALPDAVLNARGAPETPVGGYTTGYHEPGLKLGGSYVLGSLELWATCIAISVLFSLLGSSTYSITKKN